ncbi:MAG: histone deacetylase [Acidimicrobiia bacterium]
MAPAAERVLFGTLVDVDLHDTGRWHPERPERLDAVARGLADAGLAELLVPLEGRAATDDEMARVHDRRLLRSVEALATSGGGDLDPDTPVSLGSWDTARLAAGMGLAALEALRAGEAGSAFVAVRPPGHHATRDRAMGFCLVNNVAVAAAMLADAGERVLVVDWDVHHGNGTQDAFWDDDRVLYVSTHQWPAYPGTGRADEVGGPGARGLVVNVPLPAGATGDVARAALEEVAAPVVEAFGPTWVLLSAGYDAHRADPLADLAWSAGDYADLTRLVAAWAPGPGRLLAFLEGGYDLDALARSVAATVGTLAGHHAHPEPPTTGGPGRVEVAVARALRDRVLRRGA